MDYLEAAQEWAGDQTKLEWLLFVGSAVFFQILYVVFGLVNKQGVKSKSCWISHVHVFFTVPGACMYWLTQSVEIWNTTWWFDGPPETDLSNWMRCTVAFSVGYFVNDLLLMLIDAEVGGMDMLLHHILCIGFWGGGLLDDCCTAYHFLWMIEELPTPFLNLRFQYRDSKEGIIYQIGQTGFVLLFFLTRILFGTIIVGYCSCVGISNYLALQPAWRQAHCLGQIIAWVGSRALNFFWFSKIVKIVLKGGRKKHFDENKLE